MAQVELHPLSGVDQGPGGHPEAGPHEVRHRALGADPGHWPAAWQAHPAAERTDAALAWPAVPGRSAFLQDVGEGGSNCSSFRQSLAALAS